MNKLLLIVLAAVLAACSQATQVPVTPTPAPATPQPEPTITPLPACWGVHGKVVQPDDVTFSEGDSVYFVTVQTNSGELARVVVDVDLYPYGEIGEGELVNLSTGTLYPRVSEKCTP